VFIIYHKLNMKIQINIMIAPVVYGTLYYVLILMCSIPLN